MIANILGLLEVAKKQETSGKYTSIALGKNKYPKSIKEAYQQFKKELWQQEQ